MDPVSSIQNSKQSDYITFVQCTQGFGRLCNKYQDIWVPNPCSVCSFSFCFVQEQRTVSKIYVREFNNMEYQKDSRIFSWIEQSIKDEKFVKQEIVLTGTTGKTDGYSGDVIFARVSGVDAAGDIKQCDLAIKVAAQNDSLRKQMLVVREFYEREMLAYEQIFPAFRKFQEENNIVDCFDAIPKCYKTFLTDSAEVLVFENLRTKGYRLHDKSLPMNLQHIELVLDNYAKFHAISFAFQDQRPEEYKALTCNYNRHSIKMLDTLSELFDNVRLKVVQNLNDISRPDLAEKYKQASESGSIFDILNEEVQNMVITHGDCHNNNFVFQYEDNNEENPKKVAILDWQVSIQHSPAMDVAYYLYAVAGEYLYKLPELLKFYHCKLSQYTEEMGTDLNSVYPFSTLMEEWRRYSFYGFTFITTFLELCFVTEDNALNLNDMKDVNQTYSNLRLTNREEYFKRLVQIVDQYCNHQL